MEAASKIRKGISFALSFPNLHPVDWYASYISTITAEIRSNEASEVIQW